MEVGATDVNHVPIELVEMIIGFLPMKDAIHSASLVCKQWHRLVQDSDSLWATFFRRDIVELHDPLPYCPTKRVGGDERGEEDSSWKEKCVGAFARTREGSESSWDWVLSNGYLGLVRIMLPRLPPLDTEWGRISCLLSRVNNDEYSGNVVNSLRCLVALGFSPRTPDPSAFDWRRGGFLHMATSVCSGVILPFLVKEYCSEGVDEKLRLDINENCFSDGFSPLHCLFEHKTMHRKTDEKIRDNLMLLLHHGADPSRRDKSGIDCIELATKEGFAESARVMQAFTKEK